MHFEFLFQEDKTFCLFKKRKKKKKEWEKGETM